MTRKVRPDVAQTMMFPSAETGWNNPDGTPMGEIATGVFAYTGGAALGLGKVELQPVGEDPALLRLKAEQSALIKLEHHDRNRNGLQAASRRLESETDVVRARKFKADMAQYKTNMAKYDAEAQRDFGRMIGVRVTVTNGTQAETVDPDQQDAFTERYQAEMYVPYGAYGAQYRRQHRQDVIKEDFAALNRRRNGLPPQKEQAA